MSVLRTTRWCALAVVAVVFTGSSLIAWNSQSAISLQSIALGLCANSPDHFSDEHEYLTSLSGHSISLSPVTFLDHGLPENRVDIVVPLHNTVNQQTAGLDVEQIVRPAPLITFIVIWSPRPKPDIYISNFFASVAANPQVELLLVKIDKYNLANGECERAQAPGVPGVREVCVPMDEYYDLHLDYICAFWDCSAEQRESVREAMIDRFKKDKYNSSYRPFRAEIFKKWIKPDVQFWGWCDLDTMLGSFERTFPWDLADSFDVFVAGAPTEMEKVHLFMPGHMTIFRHDPGVASAFFNLEEMSSVEKYLNMPWILRPQWDGPEEAEYSHTLFMRTNLTFLRFDAMITSWHHLSTLDGVYGIENAHWMPHSLVANDGGPQVTEDALTHPAGRNVLNALLSEHSNSHREPRSTFSPEGVETEVQMRDDLEMSEGFHIWYERRYAVLYFSTLPSIAARWRESGTPARRYTMRRTPGGPVTERLEPLEQVIVPANVPHDGWHYNPGNRPWIREGLYAHYQGEKYEKWYGLPESALDPGDVLYIDRSHGVHIWDSSGKMYYERMLYVEKA